MMKRTLQKTLSLLLTAAMVLSLSACGDETTAPLSQTVSGSVSDTATEQTITILATSDIHGMAFPHEYARGIDTKSGSLARISAIVSEERKKNPDLILMDAGDTLESNMAHIFNDQAVHPIVEMMNYIGYDTWTLGNHEFNFGRAFVDRNTAASNATVLAGNLVKADGSSLFPSYEIIERDGIRVAIVGLTTPFTKYFSEGYAAEYADFECVAPIDRMDDLLAELEGKYDLLVGSLHLGFGSESGDIPHAVKEIAEQYPQFDLICSGHTHAEGDSAHIIIDENNEENKTGVLVTAPSSNGNFITKSEITLQKIDNKWAVKDVTATNIPVEGESDSAFIEKFSDYNQTALTYADATIGTVTENFLERVDYSTGSMTEVTTMPTAQLFDNAVIDFINEVQLFYSGADVSGAALFDPWSTLNAGELKRKDISVLYKYNNSIEGYHITGENLDKYLEWSASYYNTLGPDDLTVSFNPKIRSYYYDMVDGCAYTIDLTKPQGERVLITTVGGKPFDSTATYKLAVNDFRGSTLKGLGLVTDMDRYFQTTVSHPETSDIRLMIEKYITEELDGVISPKVNGNWRIVGFDFEDELVKKAYRLLGDGTIAIPKSEDGRDLNVRSITKKDITGGV